MGHRSVLPEPLEDVVISPSVGDGLLLILERDHAQAATLAASWPKLLLRLDQFAMESNREDVFAGAMVACLTETAWRQTVLQKSGQSQPDQVTR